jgi:glycosyltransferase involved in cell wall biosynthesis
MAQQSTTPEGHGPEPKRGETSAREPGTPVSPVSPGASKGEPAERPSGEIASVTLDVSVIVPVKTGDARVREVVSALGGELDRLGKSWECILVFDGVRGPAWEAAEALSREQGAKVLVLGFQQTFGESFCLAAGFDRAGGAVIITSPQYVQVDPHELETMLERIDAGCDFVSPWRSPRVDPLLNRIQSAGFNWLMRLIIKTPFHDLNCYFRAIRRQLLEEIALYGDMYRFLPVIALRQGYRVEEVKVRHLKEWGTAGFFGIGVYVRRFLDILGVVFLTKFTHKPLRFFGALGGMFLLLGSIITAGLVYQRLFVEDAGLYHRPLFLVGVMMIVLGVQVIGFGLVAEIIIFTQARNLREYRIERIYE